MLDINRRQPEVDLQRAYGLDALAENRIIIRRFFEELWEKDFSVTDQVLRVDDSSDKIADVESLEGLRNQIIGYRENFFDLQINVEDQIAEGDKVVVRLSWRGSSYVEYGDKAATRAEVEWTDIAIFRVANGKIVEHWGNSGLANGSYQAEKLLPQAVHSGNGRLPVYESKNERSGAQLAPTLHGLVTTQQELIEAKDRQIEELYLLLRQAQTAFAFIQQPRKGTSWWRRLLDW